MVIKTEVLASDNGRVVGIRMILLPISTANSKHNTKDNFWGTENDAKWVETGEESNHERREVH